MTNFNRKACRRAAKNALFPALFAVGGSVTAGSASALELGDIRVESSLGEPLRASIAFALGPNETLQKYCVSVSGATSGSGFPTISNALIDVGDGRIVVRSPSPVREPIVSTRLTVNCPYTPHISREYTMFLSPPGLQNGLTTGNAPEPRSTATSAAANRPTPVQTTSGATARALETRSPIQQGASYRVQPGESLSEIAQRIENRQIRLWPAVNALFEANPKAFIGADPNRLKAGSLLTIPDFVGNEVANFAAATNPADAAGNTADPVSATEQNVEQSNTTTGQSTTAAATTFVESASDSVAAKPAVSDNAAASEAIAESPPQPAAAATDGIVNAESIVIPDTVINDPIPAGSTPNRSVARIQPAAVPAESGTNSMLWVAGGGALLILGLLIFGRRLRDQFGSTPIGSVDETPQRRATDRTETLAAAQLPVLHDLDDDSPTDQNLALDASLGLGHDFDGVVDVNFSDDGGMGGTTRLDIELPASEEDETDMILPPNIDTSSILESEVLPDDDEYDMSVIMDMTKMPRPEDVTEKDLQAIELSTGEDSMDEGSYTVNDKVDYDILEQDYQDELSATQALNLEIEKAAQELSKRLDSEDADTTNVKIADIEEMDITATVQAQNDATLSDLDDTNVNEALVLDDDETAVLSGNDKTAEQAAADYSPTAELPAAEHGHTAELPAVDHSQTVEMPQRKSGGADDRLDAITSDGDHTVEIITRDDDTVEMEVEGGRVNTKHS